MPQSNKNISTLMEQEWDSRAKKNSLHYIAASNTKWNQEEFFAEGNRLLTKFTEPIFRQHKFDTNNKTALDIGCGVGRFTRALLTQFNFKEVTGVDVSDQMISEAKSLHTDENNLHFLKTNGIDLSSVPTESMDFVFSYVTFQHFPTIEVTNLYFMEIARILKNDGLFMIHLPTPHTRKILRLFDIVPIPKSWTSRAPYILKQLYGYMHEKDILKSTSTWRGDVMETKEFDTLELSLKSQGFTTTVFPDDSHAEGTKIWFVGTKH